MGWARMLFLGNIGQQFDIDDIEEEVERLRTRLHSVHASDNTQDKEIATLRREVTELQLLVTEMSRLLVAGGVLPADSVARLVRSVDQSTSSL